MGVGYGADEVEWRLKLFYLFRWPASFSRKSGCQVPRELPAGVGGRENRLSGRKICVGGKSRAEEEAAAGHPLQSCRWEWEVGFRKVLQLAYLLCWLEKAAGSQRRPAGVGVCNKPMSCGKYAWRGRSVWSTGERQQRHKNRTGATGDLLQNWGSDEGMDTKPRWRFPVSLPASLALVYFAFLWASTNVSRETGFSLISIHFLFIFMKTNNPSR